MTIIVLVPDMCYGSDYLELKVSLSLWNLLFEDYFVDYRIDGYVKVSTSFAFDSLASWIHGYSQTNEIKT